MLVLSSFAGAAAQLRDAILVNPYSPEDVADALAQALAMPLHERKSRWRRLMDNVEQQDVMWWLNNFVSALKEAPALRAEPVKPAQGGAGACRAA